MTKLENPDESVGIGELFTWEKDKDFRYLGCNENYAMAAGLDSPYSIIGKTDDDMPWRSLADEFRAGDQLVISGRGDERLMVQEKEIMADRVADIIVNEKKLLNNAEECIGVTGYFMDITGYTVEKKSAAHFDSKRKRLYLPEELGGGYLTEREALVLEKVALGWSARRIAEKSFKSTRTIENQIKVLKEKLNCRSKADLVATTQRNGLQFTLHDIQSLLVKN